jgi:U3 small nucleolar RNA-associated protein 14
MSDDEVDEDDDEDGEGYVDLSEMLSTGQTTNGVSKGPFQGDDASESDEESGGSDDEAFLEESEPETEEDDPLDKLGAFVDSLSSKIKEKDSEWEKLVEPPKPASEGAQIQGQADKQGQPN